ncbi:MAG: DUF1109 family protein [Labilithrix sp.]|nr:DUF1109 family protein [Labilithrix sp.]
MTTHTSDLRARILAEVKKAPSVTRATQRRRVALVSAIGALATASMFFAMGGVKAGSRPAELVAFTAGFGLFAAAVLTRLSSPSKRVPSMLGRPRSVLVTATVIAAPVLALVVLAAGLVWPHDPADEVGGRVHLACGAMTLAQGALPLVAMLIPKRGTDPVHPAITGAALGMTAGGWTVMMAYLRCPHPDGAHCLIAHVLPTLVLSAVGAALGAILLRMR